MNWLRIASIVFLGSIGLVIVVLVMGSARENYESWQELLVTWAIGFLQMVAFLFFCTLVVLAMAYAIWGHL